MKEKTEQDKAIATPSSVGCFNLLDKPPIYHSPHTHIYIHFQSLTPEAQSINRTVFFGRSICKMKKKRNIGLKQNKLNCPLDKA